ncbi:LysR substrate-binding domain-containing protein [Streptomyces sp. NPDC059949]|uniref:LysR substrate-binding domain-containing protein n=1 Tax=Streptomyces sp. NPDC059949 TaxID=3347013 RepID=UPI003666D732
MSDLSTLPTSPANTRTEIGVIRLGYHGSAEVARRIVRLAGPGHADVRTSPYDIADPFRGLYEGRHDVVIVKFSLREPDLACSRTLTYDDRAAVVGAGHPLAGRASVSIEELADYDAFRCPGSLPGYVWDEVVPPRTPAGRPIHRRHSVTDIPAMMRLVADGGAVHISLASLADVAPAAVRIVPVEDLPPAPVALAWRRGVVLPPHVHRFISAAEAGASR